MSAGWSLRHWSSTADASTLASEVFIDQTSPNSLPDCLEAAALDTHGAFCIVAIDDVDLGDLRRAVPFWENAGGRSRLCLVSKDVARLQQLDTGDVARSVGFALEVLDANVSFADLMWDRLEGVKFDAGFVARAERDIRTGLVLGGMLDLAREVGMCTLGAPATAGRGTMTKPFAFDYLPLTRKKPARATLGAPAGDVHRRSIGSGNFYGNGTDLSS